MKKCVARITKSLMPRSANPWKRRCANLLLLPPLTTLWLMGTGTAALTVTDGGERRRPRQRPIPRLGMDTMDTMVIMDMDPCVKLWLTRYAIKCQWKHRSQFVIRFQRPTVLILWDPSIIPSVMTWPCLLVIKFPERWANYHSEKIKNVLLSTQFSTICWVSFYVSEMLPKRILD